MWVKAIQLVSSPWGIFNFSYTTLHCFVINTMLHSLHWVNFIHCFSKFALYNLFFLLLLLKYCVKHWVSLDRLTGRIYVQFNCVTVNFEKIKHSMYLIQIVLIIYSHNDYINNKEQIIHFCRKKYSELSLIKPSKNFTYIILILTIRWEPWIPHICIVVQTTEHYWMFRIWKFGI